MRIGVVGGGPAGLYFALLMKAARDCEIDVVERNRADDTFGWGVVFSDETLGNFLDADPETHRRIADAFVRWDAIDVHFGGEVIRSGGHGFCGVARRGLLELLAERCREVGVGLHFETEVDPLEHFVDRDLVVAADGVNSRTRTALAAHLEPTIEEGTARFIWLGTTKVFDAFKFFIRDSPYGLFTVHAYPFDAHTSTFIVEVDHATFERAGLRDMPIADAVGLCERIFEADLEGHRLLTNRSEWIGFRKVKNATWHHGNVVLIGDAAHTAHFSIGSGTKLAMEDAIALRDALLANQSVPKALCAYQDNRWVDVAKLQKSATTSRRWFENIGRYRALEPRQMALSVLSRSKRVTYQNLRLRDPEFIAACDRWFARKSGWEGVRTPPPMFTRFALRDLVLDNRVVVSPMCQYSASEGAVDDWHLVHLGSRALGGAGLVIAEMTDISEAGRITPGCAGIYRDDHVPRWRRIVDFVHRNSRAKIGLQLGHAGRKGSTKLMWEGIDQPLEHGNWPIVAASAIPYYAHSQIPRAMTRADMEAVIGDYVAATHRAIEAGFDLLEVHMAHGYLLASFVSPLTNVRTDAYGGDLAGRMRFPLEVFDAVRRAWPGERPISVRISATDWVAGGIGGADAVEIARLLQARGCDLVDVSSGQTTPDAQPEYGRMFQTPFADRIRHEVGIATMAVGAILDWDHVNTIIAAGRADLCALARPHLYDPYFTLHAAADQGWDGVVWPDQYLAVRPRRRDGEP